MKMALLMLGFGVSMVKGVFNFLLLGRSMREIKKNYELPLVDMIWHLMSQNLREYQSTNFLNKDDIHEAKEGDLHWRILEDAQV